VITWAEIVLLLLKMANAILGQLDRDKWMKAGRDEETALIAKDIMAKTAAGKAILEKVNAMSDSEVDDALRRLEPTK